jgi:stearoyl-CoA desaturase (delta-9 desaturase)
MQATLEQSVPALARAPVSGVATKSLLITWARRLLTMTVLLTPLAALALILSEVVVDGYSWKPMVLAVAFYVLTAHGVTIGFHRLFTHKSFEAKRPLKIALAVLGSMALEGSVIGWVADHRRHHRFAEHDGDPHSPTRPETQRFGRLRGLCHARMGWFFGNAATSREKFAPDLMADRDLVIVDKLFVPLSVLTFTLPFGIGYAITGRFSGGLAAFLWAGLLRVGLFHHVSWCTNSLCHAFGERPFRTNDQSRNFAPLAALSMGEAWHKAHHAFPTLARHGVDRGQLDTSAAIIRWFERLGWATGVRWPQPVLLATRRVTR